MISPKTTWKFTAAALFVVISTVFGFGIAYAGLASKDEVNKVRAELTELQKQRAVDATIQQNILDLLRRMDQRMERLENGQADTLRAVLNDRNERGTHQPPAATPAPNPLGR